MGKEKTLRGALAYFLILTSSFHPADDTSECRSLWSNRATIDTYLVHIPLVLPMVCCQHPYPTPVLHLLWVCEGLACRSSSGDDGPHANLLNIV